MRVKHSFAKYQMPMLTYEGCFASHRVANAKKSRLYQRERAILRESDFTAMKHSQYE